MMCLLLLVWLLPATIARICSCNNYYVPGPEKAGLSTQIHLFIMLAIQIYEFYQIPLDLVNVSSYSYSMLSNATKQIRDFKSTYITDQL